jgi:hypothetical protein
MHEKMTWTDIRETFPDEWVVVTDYELVGRDLTEGVVVFHSKDKRRIHEQSRTLRQPRAVIFTGEHKRGLIGLYVKNLEDSGQT